VAEAGHLFGNVPSAVRAPLDVRDVVLDPVFGRRRDALLRMIPVHDLADRAERSGSKITGRRRRR
jgi:hypothetical protein